MSFGVRLRSNFNDIAIGCRTKEVRNCLIYYLITYSLFTPFVVFLYYFEVDYLGWANYIVSGIEAVEYINVIFAMFIYNIILSKLSLISLQVGS